MINKQLIYILIYYQDFIIPTIKNIAKLSADFKQGVEEIYTNQDNNQETLLIDDYVRQSDYKYTYSDKKCKLVYPK